MTQLRLAARTPQEWFDTHLHRHLHEWDGDDLDESARTWCTGRELLADGLTLLRAQHARHLEEGATAQAAAKWTVGAYVDLTASALGVLYLTAGAVPAALEAADLRFATHPDGWIQLVDLGDPPLLVVDGHPWVGLPGVAAVVDADALVEAFCTLIIPLAETFFAAAKKLGKVGFASLWAETSDAIGMCTLHRAGMPTGPEVLADLERLLRAPSAPWRKRPRLWFAEVAGSPHLLGQKAGCCLAYQGPQEPETPEMLADARYCAFRERFPVVAGQPSYCDVCCFRDRVDVEQRVVWELEHDHRPVS